MYGTYSYDRKWFITLIRYGMQRYGVYIVLFNIITYKIIITICTSYN